MEAIVVLSLKGIQQTALVCLDQGTWRRHGGMFPDVGVVAELRRRHWRLWPACETHGEIRFHVEHKGTIQPLSSKSLIDLPRLYAWLGSRRAL